MFPKKTAIGLTATLVLMGSVISIVRQCRPTQAPASPTYEWYYDLNAKKLFAMPPGIVPPLTAPSGPLPDGSAAGVRAYVYGCGSCSEDKRYIGYLENYNAQDKTRMAVQQRQLIQMTPNGRGPALQAEPSGMAGDFALVKRLDDKEWVGRASQEGIAIITDATRRCPDGTYPRACHPEK